jgi:hypothetical protein
VASAARHLFSIVVVALLGPASPALAFECKVSDRYDFVGLAWPSRRVPYGLAAADQEAATVVREAFAAWSAEPCTDLALEYVGLVSAGDPVSQVRFVREGWLESARAAEAVAITVSTFVRATGELRRADVEVNEELFDFGDVTAACAPTSNTYDLLAVLTHEAGHFLGLDHTRAFSGGEGDPTMAPVVGPCEADKRTLEPDDRAGLCLLYPFGAPSRPCVPLPARAGPYVKSEPFGCAASAASGGGRGLAPLIVLLAGLRLRPRPRGRQ